MPSARHLLTVARRAAGRTPLRLAFFGCLALVAAWPLLSTAGDLNTFRDAQVIAHYESVARLSVLRFHQAPLWDPYYCGGMYLLGTPQARFVAPSFLLTLLFGESRGAALTAFAMLVIALEGTFRYARARQASSLAATLAAPIFGLGGNFAIAPQNGWFNFLGFALVPWIALGFHRALRGSRKGAALAAVGVAWCTGFGGTYAVPMVALWCALELVEALVRAARARDGRRAADVVAMAFLTASLGAGLAAVRLWPVLATLRDAPRVVGGSPGSGYLDLARMLFQGTEPDGIRGQFFIGALAIPPALFAFFRRRSLVLGVYAAAWAWLAAGYGVTPSIFAAMQALPVYGTLRYPERYLILCGLVVSVLAARGLTVTGAFARSARRRRGLWRAVYTALAVGLFVNVGPLAYQYYATAATRDLAAQPLPIEAPFHQARGNRFEVAYYAPMDRGSLSCWDAYPVPESPLLEGDLPAEESLEDPSAGRVTERHWSPNRIDLDVELDRPARVRVNQNWHAGWQSNVGKVKSERGLLVVDLPAGSSALRLRFVPRSAAGGLVVSVASLVATCCLLFWGGRTRAALLAAALTPPFALLVAFVSISAPAASPKVVLAPTGEPIVVDAVTPGTTPLGVRFQGGLTLAAASVEPRKARPGETVVLELDWVREAKIDPGLGVFVHIEPESGDTISGDHVELSQALILDEAPSGKVLRDLLPITLPPGSAKKHWTVFAGLWRVLRGGDRVRVIDKGSASVKDGRVQVATFDVR